MKAKIMLIVILAVGLFLSSAQATNLSNIEVRSRESIVRCNVIEALSLGFAWS